jgi:hypothetical protein
MNLVASENGLWNPTTEEDKVKVRLQMNRLLETSHFKNSKRYPLLFQFIVEETLAGRGEFLKERLLGVRVFDRPADYDTAEDPIVRVTVAEIRKRIAQYYHEEAHDSEMRIELLPGSYLPQFQLSREAASAHRQAADSAHHGTSAHPADSADAHGEVASAEPSSRRSWFLHPVTYALGAMVLLLILLGVGDLWRSTHPPAIDELWKPFLANRRTVLFCLPVGAGTGVAKAAEAGILVPDHALSAEKAAQQAASTSQAPTSSTFLAYEVLGENVVFSDLLATLRISSYLAGHNRESNYRPNTATTLDDLRQGPVILIGGLDNQWTLRALAPLRYRFAATSQEQYWIADTKNPGMRDWGLDLKVPLPNVKRDFAIIARIHDESTGQVEMIAAGIGMSGTAAAGEFLVDPRQIEELRRWVGPGFSSRDFEAVLSTDVVNGIAGSPRILAVALR